MAGSKLSILLYLAFVSFCLAKDCQIDITKDIPKTEPVILKSSDKGSSYELFRPEGAVTTIPSGTKILFVCAGKSNKITSLGKQSIETTCKSGSFQDSNGKAHTINDLECKSIPSSDLKQTDEACGESGLIYNAGFTYNNDQFATLFQICYNVDTQQVFYTKNVINGKSINHSISESKRRSFTATLMGKTTTSVNKLYTTKEQTAHFSSLFGSKQTYINSKNFLARGHLAPDADFVFRYEQLCTYFYMNVKPEYQNINAGNWLRVESKARSIAADLDRDIVAYNGVMGNLELEGVKVFLDKNELFEVPEYYFKVLKDEKTDSAIVFISYMNPFVKDSSNLEFCKNVCAKANLYDDNYENLEKGYTFCCEFNDFSKHYDGLPSDLSASSLLIM